MQTTATQRSTWQPWEKKSEDLVIQRTPSSPIKCRQASSPGGETEAKN